MMSAAVRGRALLAQTTGTSEGPLQQGNDTSRPHLVNNDDIIRMTKAGLSDDILLQTIRLQPGHYATAPDDLIALKTGGVSDTVINAMEAHGTGLSLRSTPPGAPVARVAPSQLTPGVDEIGVYYKDKEDQWVELKSERVQFKSGGWVKSTFTHDIIKEDLNGHVDGAQSSLVVPTGVEILIYAPAGTQAEEYDLLRFRDHSTSREFRVKTGGVFHSETGTQRDNIEFHPQRLNTQMYTFTIPADIEKGEYGILPPGSSNTPGLANAGKIFTFSIRQ